MPGLRCPACLAVFAEASRGPKAGDPCPNRCQASPQGPLLEADQGFACPKCGAAWPAGVKALHCVTCQAVYCAACRDRPTVHAFSCFAGGS